MSRRKWWKIASQEQEWFGYKKRQEHPMYEKIKAVEPMKTITKKMTKLESKPNHIKIQTAATKEHYHSFDNVMER